MDFDALLTREVLLGPARAALLFVDVQNFCAHRRGGEFKDRGDAAFEARYGEFFRHLRSEVVPNMRRLQQACRQAGVEVRYTVIQSLTKDRRDRSLDYKITGFHVPRR